MKVKTSELTGMALDWVVANIENPTDVFTNDPKNYSVLYPFSYADWQEGGPIIERANITIIRANDDYEVDAKGFTTDKRIPQWFAECSRWTGHSLNTSYEGEHMEPTFMISESGGYYGPTPLVAAMRCWVACNKGDEIDIPDEVMK